MLLQRDRKRTITDKIVALIREGFEEGQPSKFWCEGSARYGLRSSLCLQGWSWTPADNVAAEIVAAALNKVGARRPGWYEGQPEWTQPGALPIERDCCRHCRKPLPEGRRVFCCIECKRWHHGERAKQAHEEERRAYQKAWYAARSARLPEQVCEGCGRSYRPKRPGQRFCSVDCANHVYANPANL